MAWPHELKQPSPNRFTITDDHLLLLKRMHFRFEAGIEFGAPAVDPKRPYGNGDVFGDMRHILGVEAEDTTEGRTELSELHREMALVLQIGCRLGRFETGTYTREPYSINWTPA
jgi:hypothetical protein